MGAVQFFDGQQLTVGAVADEEPLEVLADTLLPNKGVADRNIVDDGIGCEQGQRPIDVEGVGGRDEGFNELLPDAWLLTRR